MSKTGKSIQTGNMTGCLGLCCEWGGMANGYIFGMGVMKYSQIRWGDNGITLNILKPLICTF